MRVVQVLIGEERMHKNFFSKPADLNFEFAITWRQLHRFLEHRELNFSKVDIAEVNRAFAGKCVVVSHFEKALAGRSQPALVVRQESSTS